MRDLRERFQALDHLEAPYQWTEIEQRAARPGPARAPSWMHGAWVAATAAAAVLVFVGGVVAGRWLLGAGSLLEAAFGGSGPFQPATPADVSVLATVVAGATGGSVLLAAALTLAWRWKKRDGRSVMSETRGGEMDTMEKTIEKPARTIERVTRNNRWLILAVVVLFAALAALGAWLLVDTFAASDVEALIDDFQAAWNGYDYEALAALVTDDFIHVDTNAGETFQGEEALRARLATYEALGFEREDLGPVTVSGNWASRPQRVTFSGLGTYEGFSVFEIEGDRIKAHYAVFSPAS